MAYTLQTSPLRHVDKLPPLVTAQTSPRRRDEDGEFVNDAVKTWHAHRARRLPIIPHYDAKIDRQAKAYFLAPSVQDVIRCTISMEDLRRSDSTVSLNKMSTRRVIPKTPSKDAINGREKTYVNDAVLTNNKRTKYRDIIPRYDASLDWHSRIYFSRPDIQDLVAVTRGGKSPHVSRRRVGRFALSTPTAEDLKRRENMFINDAILTEKKKTRFWDMIPPYQGEKDPNAKKYFERQREVKRLHKSLKQLDAEKKAENE